MAEEFDPVWEYGVVDPEIEEAVYGNHVAASKMDLITDERLQFGAAHDNQGLTFGHGNPNRLSSREAPDPFLPIPLPQHLPTKPRSNAAVHEQCLVCNKTYILAHYSTEPQRNGFCTSRCLRKRQLERVKLLYIGGVTLDEIADRLGICKKTVYRIMRTIPGLPRRPDGWQPVRERVKGCQVWDDHLARLKNRTLTTWRSYTASADK